MSDAGGSASRGTPEGEGKPLPSSPQTESPGPKSPLLTIADHIDGAIDKLCQAVLLTTGTVLMGALTANVIARYVLSTGGFDWAEEIPEQLFPWFIMAGVALAVQHLGHVAVEWLRFMLSPPAARLLLLGGHVLVLVAYILVTQQALIVADIVSIERSAVLQLSKTYGYWAIAAGSVLVCLSTIAGGLRVFVLGPEGLERSPRFEATS